MCEYEDRVNSLICQLAEETDARKIQSLRSEMHNALLDALLVKTDRVLQSMSDNNRILSTVYTGFAA